MKLTSKPKYGYKAIVTGLIALLVLAALIWTASSGWLNKNSGNPWPTLSAPAFAEVTSTATEELLTLSSTATSTSYLLSSPTPFATPIVASTLSPSPSPSPFTSNWVDEDQNLNVTRFFSDTAEVAQLVFSDEDTLTFPSHLAILDGKLYTLAGGILYECPLPSSTSLPEQLGLTSVMPAGNRVEGLPIKELLDMALGQASELYLLDKSNDLYKYTPDGGWTVDLAASSYPEIPDSHYVALVTYNNRRYLLDIARNQIWRHPPSQDYPPQYFPEVLPWLIQPGDPDVTQGISLAIDGRIFVLTEVGVRRFELGRISPTFEITPTIPQPAGTHLASQLEHPLDIFLTDELPDEIFIADGGGPRVVALDRETGQYRRQFLLYTPQHTDQVQDLAIIQNHIYALSGNYLIKVNITDAPTTRIDLSLDALALPTPGPPIDRDLLAYLQTFIFPIKGAYLPDRLSVFPGARRVYRYGVHEGLDIYSFDQDMEVEIGYPVRAAADGVVVRADLDYQEMSPIEYENLISQTIALHATPEELEDKLRGRQVWIEHKYGVTTRYVHLSRIADGVAVGVPVSKGQVIGYVGVSGTSSGVYGTGQYPHLHFEIRLRDNYLGKGLSLVETRHLWRSVFSSFVKPVSVPD
jgi:murein DD-endopeptidase MepM/ murein hydrolase activator NlpD